MNTKRDIALWTLAVAGLVCITMGYFFAPETMPSGLKLPTMQPAAVMDGTSPSDAAAPADDIMPGVTLKIPVPLPWFDQGDEGSEFIYGLGESASFGPGSCTDFEALPSFERSFFLGDALEDAGSNLDRFNYCVRRHSTEVGKLVAARCRNGVTLKSALKQAVGYFELECDYLPQFNTDRVPDPHTEFMEESF